MIEANRCTELIVTQRGAQRTMKIGCQYCKEMLTTDDLLNIVNAIKFNKCILKFKFTIIFTFAFGQNFRSVIGFFFREAARVKFDGLLFMPCLRLLFSA